VTSGSNGTCSPTYLCKGTVGYDGPTGLGTPNGGAAFVAIAPTPDFSVSASPSLTLNVNASGSSTITLGASNGYSGNVNVSAAVTGGSPSGLTITQPVSPAGVPSSASTVGVLADTAGSYTVTVTATDGTRTHTATFTVTVNGPNFTVSASPSTLPLGVAPSSGSSTINLAALNGYSGSVNLSAAVTSGATSGLTLTQPTSPVATIANAATVGIAGNTAGTYTVTVTATDTVNSALTHTAAITVTVASPAPPPPSANFTVSVSPTSAGAQLGGTVKLTVTVAGNVGTGAVLSVTGQNAGDTASFSVNPMNAAGTSVLTIKLSTVARGARTLTIKGTNGSYSKSATATIVVF
jgi:hypothetical protein